MNDKAEHKPVKLNLDKSFPDMTPQESYYLLNHVPFLSNRTAAGNNLGAGKPLPSNYAACEIDQPAGETYTVGGYRSPLTNELYSWHFNNNGVHYILRTTNSGCDVVYTWNCFTLSAEPKHSIESFRAFLRVEKICPNRDGKYLIWTNGDGPIGCIDVEAAIATTFFTTSFFARCPDLCALTELCVPDPCKCLHPELMPLDPSDVGLNSFIADKPFQFIFKYIYYDGRQSIWSIPSGTIYQKVSGCFDNTTGGSRCIKLRIPVGNPLVEKIAIGFTDDLKNWYVTETVEKYKKYNSSQEKWYQRDLSETVAASFSAEDCSFDYVFCNDKGRASIDVKELTRVRNPIPRNAQGLLSIKGTLGFYNYIDGNCPVDKLETEKFEITENCTGVTANDCVSEFVSITVRAVIHRENQRNQFIYRMNGALNEIDDPADPAYFGSNAQAHDQLFADKTRNFITYIEGTDFWGNMDQWQADAFFVNNKKRGVLPGGGTPTIFNAYAGFVANGGFLYQETTIKVPKGSRGFLRLASHEVTSGAGSNQNTSTFVYGIIPDIHAYKGNLNITGIIDTSKKEIYFDTCNGDIVLNPTFVILDQGQDSSYNGYIKDKNGFPVEGALVSGGTLNLPTDHNGFYFFHTLNTTVASNISVETDCAAFANVQTMNIVGAASAATKHDEVITSANYADHFYANVKFPITDCNGTPIPGLRAAISGSKFRVTDAFGVATFRVRNYSTRNRLLVAVVLNNNGCLTADCANNCNPCMPQKGAILPACLIGTPPPTVNLPAASVNVNSVGGERGLKAGGRYGWGIVAHGDCGRLSAVYPVGSGYMDIQKTQQRGKLTFCDFKYNSNGMVLPSWAKCLDIVRTANLNPFELQWVVDKIERTSDGKVKLTIQSLNDYNQRYFFQTNTVYEWLKNDRVEFIRNGDGKIFDTTTYGLLNYLTISPFHDQLISGQTDAPANYFNQLLINDDSRLNILKEGAVIEIQRPKATDTENIYYSICATIPVKSDGTLVIESGDFSTYDTFVLNRTAGNFLGSFEHFSPSDFWGDRITRVSDSGKAFVQNQFETERRYGRNISLSGATIFNYFGDLIKKFDAPEQGDIIAATIVDDKIILAIGENDNFLCQTADELVRVGGDGIIRAIPPDSIISDPQPKVVGAYGCKYDHVGSVAFGDGFATWFDGNRHAYIKHDYNEANDVSLGKVQTHFRTRGQEIDKLNSTELDPLNKYRFAKGYNCVTGIEYITIKTLRDSAVNNEKKALSKSNDTIMYHPYFDDWFGYASHTPEFYGQLTLNDQKGCALVSFFNAVPYIHPIISDTFNNFFGFSCDEIMSFTFNKGGNKQKIAAALEIQSGLMWYAYEIRNETPNFISEIPAIRWTKNKGKWNANFLFNRNAKCGLYGNNAMAIQDDTRGFYINISLIRDNTDSLKYGTIDNAKRLMYNETDSILVKFVNVEQTGFENNL